MVQSASSPNKQAMSQKSGSFMSDSDEDSETVLNDASKKDSNMNVVLDVPNK